MTLREEINGEKTGGGGGKPANVNSVLRMQHLQNLALWAGGKASIPYTPLFGNRLATCGEAAGIPLDPSLFPCQRCESILQPGFNCTVRVETNGAKVRRRRNKLHIPPKNFVVHTCHFCSHRNVKRGTPKYHMKETFASRPGSEKNPASTDKKLVSYDSAVKGSKEIDKNMGETTLSQLIPVSKPDSSSSIMHPEPRKEAAVENSPTTPKLLLEGRKKRKKRSGSSLKEKDATESNMLTPNAEKVVGESSKRRRKGWSSLKEIAGNSDSVNRNVPSLPLPFFI